MALYVKTSENSSSDIKVEGDVGDLQIIEESSDDEDSCHAEVKSPALTALSNIPNGLVKTGNTPVIGAVQVTNSDNVQFGNNTYFNGPVTIKQVIQSNSGVDLGVDNATYQKTEDEEIRNSNNHKKYDSTSGPAKPSIKVWHKLSLSAAGVIILASIAAVVVVSQLKGKTTHSITNINEDSSSSTNLLIAPWHLRIVSRTDWLAQPIHEHIDAIRQPAPWAIITHTATTSCFTQSACVLNVRLIQTFHIESRHWSDIGYNFLVGGDGSAYVGRGWDQIGAHTKGYNKYAIGVAFVGTFNTESPTEQQVNACKNLLEMGVAEGKLAKDYKLLAHRQLMSTLSPGDKVFDIIKTWPNFYNDTDISKILPNY